MAEVKKTSSTKPRTTAKKKTTQTKSATTKKTTTTKPKTTAAKKTTPKTVVKKEPTKKVEEKTIVEKVEKPIAKQIAKPVSNKPKVVAKTKEDDSWVYVCLLTAVALLTISLKPFVFNQQGIDISFSIFLLPFVFFTANYITKKFGYIETLKAIFASALAMIVYLIITSLIFEANIGLVEIGGDIFGYIAAQLVNLTIYYYLLVYAEGHGLLIFMNFVFSILVFHFVFMLFSFSSLPMETYNVTFMTSLIIQLIIFIPLSFLDSQVAVKKQKYAK